MKILIYSPYLNILGGGEQYLFQFADCFKDEHEIFWVWKDPKILKKLTSRFQLELKNMKVLPFLPPRLRLREFDVIFVVSDGSVPFVPFGKSILLFMSPFVKVGGKSLANQIKLKFIRKIVCFSEYTQKYIDAEFGVKSNLIYPAVEVSPIKVLKENIILSVGRFITTLHQKKQESLIEAFIEIEQQLPKWQLILVGGTELGSERFVQTLRKKARGHRIAIKTDISASGLSRLYAQAKIYWHAAGFGADLRQNPQKAEHFGISIVEAMGNGTVPIVFNAGGPTEIVTPQSGRVWNSLKELKELTQELAHNNQKREEIAGASKQRASIFNKQKFCERWHEIITPK